MIITWAALTSSAGIRHLGYGDHVLEAPVRIIGCSGLPQSIALAIVVWGDLGFVHGVPRTEFTLDGTQPACHVWRTAAAAHLKVNIYDSDSE